MAARRLLIRAIDAALADWCESDMTWGTDDCLMGLANIYVVALGIDPASAWRGRYRTERGARRVMGRGGVLRAVGHGARSVGWQRIKPAEARPGDLGVARTINGHAGVIRHRRDWLGRRDRGFTAIPPEYVVTAWRATCPRS